MVLLWASWKVDHSLYFSENSGKNPWSADPRVPREESDTTAMKKVGTTTKEK